MNSAGESYLVSCRCELSTQHRPILRFKVPQSRTDFLTWKKSLRRSRASENTPFSVRRKKARALKMDRVFVGAFLQTFLLDSCTPR